MAPAAAAPPAAAGAAQHLLTEPGLGPGVESVLERRPFPEEAKGFLCLVTWLYCSVQQYVIS